MNLSNTVIVAYLSTRQAAQKIIFNFGITQFEFNDVHEKCKRSSPYISDKLFLIIK